MNIYDDIVRVVGVRMGGWRGGTGRGGASPDVTAAGFALSALVSALSAGVTYESFIKTGLIA